MPSTSTSARSDGHVRSTTARDVPTNSAASPGDAGPLSRRYDVTTDIAAAGSDVVRMRPRPSRGTRVAGVAPATRRMPPNGVAMRINCSWMCVALHPRHQRENSGGTSFVTAVETAPLVISAVTTFRRAAAAVKTTSDAATPVAASSLRCHSILASASASSSGISARVTSARSVRRW